MSLFAIGDTHLALGNPQKSMEIFPMWEKYVERLSENWGRIIGEDDTVVVAGDVSWAMRLDECGSDFAFLNSLPGKKILLKGNHDYWWSTRKKLDEYVSDKGFTTLNFMFNDSYVVGDVAVCGTRGWFYDDDDQSGKVLLRERQRLITSIESAAENVEKIVFLHYPPIYEGKVCNEIFSVLQEYGIKKCFFGHIHSDRIGRYSNFTYEGISFSLISADSLGFCPKLIKKF